MKGQLSLCEYPADLTGVVRQEVECVGWQGRSGWTHVAVLDGVLLDSCGVVHHGAGVKRCRVEPGLRRAVREVLIHREPLPGLRLASEGR